MHLTGLQSHLVSDTKNFPLPGTNLFVKLFFCYILQFLHYLVKQIMLPVTSPKMVKIKTAGKFI